MIRRGFYRIFLAILFLGISLCAHATHQKAAELRVEHVSGYTYRAILITYTYTGTQVDRPEIEIAWGDGTFETVARLREAYLGNETKMNRYEAVHTYAGPGVYTLFMEDPNRNSGVVNIPGSVLTYMYVSTTITISPWLGAGNSTPVTTIAPVDDNACLGKLFTHNPGAYDPDGDSISYRLIPCRTLNGEDIPGYTYPAARDSFYIDSRNGTLFWDVPTAQGEYNVAILMEEWRNRIKIGSLTRDMQIVVRACDNNPPEIVADETYCVEAGQVLLFPVQVIDRDGNRLRLEATGEILTGGRRAGLQSIYDSLDSAAYNFYWITDLSESRALPYMLYLRAEDDGDPHLSAVKTVAVTVTAPAVQFTEVSPAGKLLRLAWNKSLSPHAVGYELYRRDFWQTDLTGGDDCQTGISDTAYRRIASFSASSDTVYVDSGLEEGREYCYKVVVTFADGAKSKASDAYCVELPNVSPLLTRVSVAGTDVYDGRLEVSWIRPQEADSAVSYRLFGGSEPDSLAFIAEFPFDSCVHYTDSGRNTEQLRYFYRVEIDEKASSPASSVYLTATGKPYRVELAWVWDAPWEVLQFNIYRYSDSDSGFVRIDSTVESFYVDRAVSANQSYRYYVEAVGSYRSRRMPDLLYNLSNQVTETALYGEPCTSYLFLMQSSCNPLSNTLTWSFDSLYTRMEDVDSGYVEDCRASLSYYELYRRNPDQKEYTWIATLQGTEYQDTDPGSLFSCYRVVGVSESGQESEPSNTVCTDNWHCFVFDLPNVFTPNGDGINDVLRARDYSYINSFSIKIVNRWGVEVFKSDRLDFEWNGQLHNKGKACPDGAYFYMAEFEGIAEGRVLKKVQSGSVTILR